MDLIQNLLGPCIWLKYWCSLWASNLIYVISLSLTNADWFRLIKYGKSVFWTNLLCTDGFWVLFVFLLFPKKKMLLIIIFLQNLRQTLDDLTRAGYSVVSKLFQRTLMKLYGLTNAVVSNGLSNNLTHCIVLWPCGSLSFVHQVSSVIQLVLGYLGIYATTWLQHKIAFLAIEEFISDF